MWTVGGRVRKGNPSNFVQTLDMISETPARGGGFQRLRLMPPTPSDLGFEILRFESSGSKIRGLRFEIWDFWASWGLRFENWDVEVWGLRNLGTDQGNHCKSKVQINFWVEVWGLSLHQKKKNNYFEGGFRSKKLVSKQGTDQQNVKSQIRGTDQRIPDLEVAQIICQVRCQRACGPNPQAQIKESRLDKRYRSLCTSLFGGWAYRTWRFWIRTLRLETRASNEPGN